MSRDRDPWFSDKDAVRAISAEITRLRSENERLTDIIRREAWLEQAGENDVPGPYVPWDDHIALRREHDELVAALEEVAREDELVTASGGAFALQALRARQSIAYAVLARVKGEK